MKMKNLARCDIADTFRSRMLNAEDGLGMMWECGERGMLILLMLLRCQKIAEVCQKINNDNEELDHAMIRLLTRLTLYRYGSSQQFRYSYYFFVWLAQLLSACCSHL
jgi:hypothetical protein